MDTKYGKIWLLPYDTGRNDTGRPVAYTWYDELVISRNRIADPGGTGSVTTSTVSITTPTQGSAVSGAAVTVSANASSNTAIAGVQFKVDGTNLGRRGNNGTILDHVGYDA